MLYNPYILKICHFYSVSTIYCCSRLDGWHNRSRTRALPRCNRVTNLYESAFNWFISFVLTQTQFGCLPVLYLLHYRNIMMKVTFDCLALYTIHVIYSTMPAPTYSSYACIESLKAFLYILFIESRNERPRSLE